MLEEEPPGALLPPGELLPPGVLLLLPGALLKLPFPVDDPPGPPEVLVLLLLVPGALVLFVPLPGADTLPPVLGAPELLFW